MLLALLLGIAPTSPNVPPPDRPAGEASCTDDYANKDNSEALRAADSYLWKEHKIKTDRLKRAVYDDGDSWIISYKPPPDTMGGSALVQIHKESKSVVAVSLGQ